MTVVDRMELLRNEVMICMSMRQTLRIGVEMRELT